MSLFNKKNNPDIIIYLKRNSSQIPAPIDKYIFSSKTLPKNPIFNSSALEIIFIKTRRDMECIRLSNIIPNKNDNLISEDMNKFLFFKKIKVMINIKNNK